MTIDYLKNKKIDFIIDNKRIIPIEVKLNYNDRLIKKLIPTLRVG